ncbi:MAG TPA: cation-translocating P-type ATPase C-terminal domain-containing protein, partial [Gemmatimonadales bacterium]|nr:cation-translocating P-type ATPase C-terminal domain-containing protein [Gemmatimonadales bacterium]
KFVLYLFSCNLAELLVLLGAGLAGYPSALPPLQILWLNLLTDTAPALALAVEPGERAVMHRRPDPRGALLPSAMLWSAVGYALLIALVTLAAFTWGVSRADTAHATTLAFMTLAFAQIFHLGNARSAEPVVAWRRILANRYALGAALVAVCLQLLAGLLPPLRRLLHVAPLSLHEWLIVGALGLAPAIVGQGLKAWRRSIPA